MNRLAGGLEAFDGGGDLRSVGNPAPAKSSSISSACGTWSSLAAASSTAITSRSRVAPSDASLRCLRALSRRPPARCSTTVPARSSTSAVFGSMAGRSAWMAAHRPAMSSTSNSRLSSARRLASSSRQKPRSARPNEDRIEVDMAVGTLKR